MHSAQAIVQPHGGFVFWVIMHGSSRPAALSGTSSGNPSRELCVISGPHAHIKQGSTVSWQTPRQHPLLSAEVAPPRTQAKAHLALQGMVLRSVLVGLRRNVHNPPGLALLQPWEQQMCEQKPYAISPAKPEPQPVRGCRGSDYHARPPHVLQAQPSATRGS